MWSKTFEAHQSALRASWQSLPLLITKLHRLTARILEAVTINFLKIICAMIEVAESLCESPCYTEAGLYYDIVF